MVCNPKQNTGVCQNSSHSLAAPTYSSGDSPMPNETLQWLVLNLNAWRDFCVQNYLFVYFVVAFPMAVLFLDTLFFSDGTSVLSSMLICRITCALCFGYWRVSKKSSNLVTLPMRVAPILICLDLFETCICDADF